MSEIEIKVPMLVADPSVCSLRGIDCFENVQITGAFFLDGPVTERVAVLDFEELTGELQPGVRYIKPAPGRKIGRYETNDDAVSRPMQALSVFATVMKTIQAFEDREVLGRRIGWAFGSPQLFVVPRAGELANAFYERESHSLQFFFFTNAENQRVYACASRDIVAHETAHALLDGIAPDLHHAATPQSLALHECVADMVALMSAFTCRKLAESVLAETQGLISQPTAFSQLAEEFGGKRPLRMLRNDKKLSDVAIAEPHALSEVLSGALYAIVEALYENAKKTWKPERALGGMASQFRRILLRSLDYLPPGEISFADYGRAIIASDQAAYPDDTIARSTLIGEMVKRGIVSRAKALAVKTNFKTKVLKDVDLDTLVDSDWAAYEFANTNREFLRIPPGIHFRVLPRLRATRSYRRKGEDEDVVNEIVFKVSWDQKEKNKLPGYAALRQITVGTTLAIDEDTGEVRALLTSDFEEQAGARDAFLQKLAARGLLGTQVRVEQSDGLMRVRGTAQMLHVVGEDYGR